MVGFAVSRKKPGKGDPMTRIAITCDSNSGIVGSEARELDVHVLPMPFYIDGKAYLEGVDLRREDFYRLLREEATIKTSQPSPGDTIELWEKLLETYDFIIHIPMSRALSSSYETSLALSSAYEGRVCVVDNRRISVTQRQSVLDAKKLAAQGLPAAEIRDRLEKNGLEASIYLAVDTLKYLKNGGRITPAAALIGTVLNIKPVLQIQGGKIDSFAKVRGMRQAEKKLIEAVHADLDTRFLGRRMTVHAAYSGDSALRDHWKNTVQEAFPQFDVTIRALSLNITCHTGEGALGLACMQVE